MRNGCEKVPQFMYIFSLGNNLYGNNFTPTPQKNKPRQYKCIMKMLKLLKVSPI